MHLSLLLIIAPIAWLMAAMLVLGACRIAARADQCSYAQALAAIAGHDEPSIAVGGASEPRALSASGSAQSAATIGAVALASTPARRGGA